MKTFSESVSEKLENISRNVKRDNLLMEGSEQDKIDALLDMRNELTELEKDVQEWADERTAFIRDLKKEINEGWLTELSADNMKEKRNNPMSMKEYFENWAEKCEKKQCDGCPYKTLCHESDLFSTYDKQIFFVRALWEKMYYDMEISQWEELKLVNIIEQNIMDLKELDQRLRRLNK